MSQRATTCPPVTNGIGPGEQRSTPDFGRRRRLRRSGPDLRSAYAQRRRAPPARPCTLTDVIVRLRRADRARRRLARRRAAARSSASSVPTAPARRRCSTSSAASCAPDAGRRRAGTAALAPASSRTSSPARASPAPCRASACSRGLTVARERDGRRATAPRGAGLRQRAARRCRARDRDERALRGSAPCARSTSSASPTSPTGCPATLPYGVQKRVALARALVAEPRAAAARRAGQRAVGERDRRARRAASARCAAGSASLLVEHHMDLVMAVCDRVVVLDFGQRDRGRHAGRGRRPTRRVARRLPRRRGRARRRWPVTRR